MKNHFFKLSTLAILGTALFGMTACSDKDDVAGSENATDDAKQYIAVNIQSVQSMAMRSRAVYLPFSCCLAIAFSPPPRRALARRSINS